MQPFAMYELLFYLLPILASVIVVRFVRPILAEFSAFKLTVSMLLLPLWIVIIEGFGWRLYDLSFFPYWCYVMLVVLWIHYFDYIRKIDCFEWEVYLRIATRLVFTTSSFILFSMSLLRLYTYFN